MVPFSGMVPLVEWMEAMLMVEDCPVPTLSGSVTCYELVVSLNPDRQGLGEVTL